MTSTTSTRWTLLSALQWSVDFLKSKGSDSPRVDAELLLCDVLGFQRVQLYTNFDRPLDESEREKYRGHIRRRAAGEPVAYILGTKEFAGREFLVSPDVLIPRPETELLVEHVTGAIKSAVNRESGRKIRVLDAGTGTGCIAVSIASWWVKEMGGSESSLSIDAWDVSDAALSVANANAARHGVSDLVHFEKIDMLDPSAWRSGVTWDFVVSNPPYIGDEEFAGLVSSVKDFEPRLALWGSPDGLRFYRSLAEFARSSVAPEGKIFLEIGYRQGDIVRDLLKSHGWSSIQVELDYARHPRNVIAVNPRG